MLENIQWIEDYGRTRNTLIQIVEKCEKYNFNISTRKISERYKMKGKKVRVNFDWKKGKKCILVSMHLQKHLPNLFAKAYTKGTCTCYLMSGHLSRFKRKFNPPKLYRKILKYLCRECEQNYKIWYKANQSKAKQQ